MGTSGVYGGSERQQWKSARQLLQGLLDQTDGGPVGGGSEDGNVINGLAAALCDALISDDPSLDGPPIEDDILDVAGFLPSRRAGALSAPHSGLGSGGVPAGGVFHGSTGAVGRRGSGSSRTVTRSAARGGAVLAGGYALRARDASTLAELGLDLAKLEQASPRMQCAQILDAVLGDGGHPDEHALRVAAAEQLKAIILADEPPSPTEAIRGFIASFVFQLGLVELRSALRLSSIAVEAAVRIESRLHRWIERRVKQVQIPDVDRLVVRDFMGAAARLSQEAMRLLKTTLGAET